LEGKVGQFSGTLNNFVSKSGTLTDDSAKGGTGKKMVSLQTQNLSAVPQNPALSHPVPLLTKIIKKIKI